MRNKGFTLIELLIVIIVIGILATLMLPQIGQMTEKARSAEASNVIGALRTSIAIEAMESGTIASMVDNAAINTALGTIIDPGTTLYNYGVTVAGANPQICTVVAKRNTLRFNASRWIQVTVTFSADGNITIPLDATVVEVTTQAPAAPGAVPGAAV